MVLIHVVVGLLRGRSSSARCELTFIQFDEVPKDVHQPVDSWHRGTYGIFDITRIDEGGMGAGLMVC